MLKVTTSLMILLQLLKPNNAVELLTELDVHDIPFGVMAGGFGVVVWVLLVEGGLWF